VRCRAKTRAGVRCRRRALVDGERCHAHSGVDVGRPEKLTDEVRRRLVEAVRAGCPREVAAKYAGISRSTLHRWLSPSNKEERFRELQEELKQAEAEAEFYAIATLRRAMADDWRAALAYLERRHPARWGRRWAPGAGSGEGGLQAKEVSGGAIIADPKARRLIGELRDRLARAREA
jgi:hypothetical protein